MARVGSLSTRYTLTKGTLPRVPFSDIATSILGPNYELSLVICGDALGRRINREYYGRDYPTNVLAFPLDDSMGEIFINLRRVERDAHLFGRTTKNQLAFLFIHACLHLKGHDHGDSMEKLEKKILKKFGFK